MTQVLPILDLLPPLPPLAWHWPWPPPLPPCVTWYVNAPLGWGVVQADLSITYSEICLCPFLALLPLEFYLLIPTRLIISHCVYQYSKLNSLLASRSTVNITLHFPSETLNWHRTLQIWDGKLQCNFRLNLWLMSTNKLLSLSATIGDNYLDRSLSDLLPGIPSVWILKCTNQSGRQIARRWRLESRNGQS